MVLPKQKPILYNGSFTKYTFDNRATGSPFEVFTMMGVGPNEDVPTFIDNDNIYVYVEEFDESGNQKYENVVIVKSLILEASYNDLMCETRFNENKELELKFGDGIHGKRLEKGNIIHVIYLKSNGKNGIINANELNVNTLSLKIDGFSSKNELINCAFDGNDLFLKSYSALFSNDYIPIFETRALIFSNAYESTPPLNYEDVKEIKENAPSSFRIGNRLVTSGDFRTYILDKFKNVFKDAYVCNNNEYCSLFYKWLDSYDKLSINIRLKNYEYANACDFNNIYIFLNSMKPEGLTDADRKHIINVCEKLKPLTANIIPCEGIHCYFMPYVESSTKNVDKSNIFNDPLSIESHIIIKKKNTYFSDAKIKSTIIDIITKYFNENDAFGAKINLADLQQKIYALGYVDSIQTVSIHDVKNNYYTNYVNGLSFAKFTSDIIEMRDFDCFTQMIELEKFQYGTLLNPSSLMNLIEIVNENEFALKNNEF